MPLYLSSFSVMAPKRVMRLKSLSFIAIFCRSVITLLSSRKQNRNDRKNFAFLSSFCSTVSALILAAWEGAPGLASDRVPVQGLQA
jgi:hypothetical protein